MIIALIIGTIVFVIKTIVSAMKFAWAISKTIIFVIALPLLILELVLKGLMYVALIVLGVALIGAFLGPIYDEQ